MLTLMNLAQDIIKIRETVNLIEVRGKNNAALVIYAYDKCNEIIQAINEITMSIQNGKNESAEEGDANGEPDSGAAEPD